MQYFKTPLTIQLTEKQIARAIAFAKSVIETVNYSDSNQHNRAKIQNDHFISKLGEEAVKIAFEQFHCFVAGPDYTIYKGRQKSWEEDLHINETALAVKTQKTSTAKRYTLSWTFQSSSYRKDPILELPDAWICFVECDDTQEYLCKVYPPMQIKTLAFREPKLAYLKGKKRVVYAEDMGF